jgi:hypothetical protein
MPFVKGFVFFVSYFFPDLLVPLSSRFEADLSRRFGTDGEHRDLLCQLPATAFGAFGRVGSRDNQEFKLMSALSTFILENRHGDALLLLKLHDKPSVLVREYRLHST